LSPNHVAAKDAQKIYDLKMPVNGAQTENYYNIAKDLAKELKIMSDGRLNIRVLPINQVVPIAEAWDAVAKGTVEMAHVYPGYHTGKMPAADIESCLPFTFRNEEEMRIFWHNYGYLDFLNKEVYADTNTYILGQVYFSGYQLWMKEPATTIEQLRKMKIRSVGALAKLLGKCDIPTVFIAPPEIYTAMSTGVINGALNGGIVQGYDLKYHEVAKYMLDPKLQAAGNCSIYINRQLWNSLPDDLKLMLKQFALSYNEAITRDFDTREIQLRGLLKTKEGIKFVTLDAAGREQLSKAAKALVKEYAEKGPMAAKAVSLLEKFLDDRDK